jgi:propanol-preferring alcohol dehydrogenase
MKAVIDTTPVWKTVVCAMENLQPGGRLVINAIRKENTDKGGLMLLDYGKHLWQEKEIKSVANVTRKDIDEFLKLADKFGIKPQVELFHLEDAVTALKQIKQRQIRGAKVLTLS